MRQAVGPRHRPPRPGTQTEHEENLRPGTRRRNTDAPPRRCLPAIQPQYPMNALRTFFLGRQAARHTAWLAPLLAAALVGCAAPGAGEPAAAPGPMPAAAPQISVPPTSVGAWVDLGHLLAPWLGGDAQVPVDGVASPTRVAGLRREDGQWLAIVIAQAAPAGSLPCPQATSLSTDGGTNDPCLRQRRDADFDRWLGKQHPVLYRWLEGRELGARPRAWVSYRASAAGAIETHALVDPSLLEAVTRNNSDFLAAGMPGVQWARQFAVATRAAGSGTLVVPPFPYGPPTAAPAQVPASAPAPVVQAPKEAIAEPVQVAPSRPPAQKPRPDRE